MDKIVEMEKIVSEYENMIESIENSQNWRLFDCKYTNKGIDFIFNDCATDEHVILSLKKDKR